MATEAINAVQKFVAHSLEIRSVTVYTDRAEVKRNVKTKLEPGMNEVVVENIPNAADSDSIIISGHGDAIIHEVQVKDVPVLPDESNLPRLQELRDELKKLEDQENALSDSKKVTEKRHELLNSIIAKAGEAVIQFKDKESGQHLSADVTCEGIAKLINYHEDEYTNVLEKMRKVDEELRQLGEKRVKLHEQIGDTQRLPRYIRNVHITLESKKGGDVDLDLSYQVHNASWYPLYEIRVESTAKTLKLTYFGNIHQSTGEDWMDVPLILSTAQPSLGGTPPRLGTLNVELYKPPPPPQPRPAYYAHPGGGSLFGARKMKVAQESVNAFEFEQREGVGFAAEMPHAEVAVAERGISSMFMIPRRASIPSDSAEHKVVIATLDLKPKMFYETIPSKSVNAYLTASVINDSAMPLLSGQASVYVDSSFIAKNQIKAVSPGERFKCSLGVDPAIKIEYRPVHKYSGQAGLITRSVSTMNEQKIVLKNTKSSAVLITVREHVPKSSDEKIKIKLFSPELDNRDTNARGPDAELAVGARLDANHNLEWVMNLEPNKEEELTVKWSVEYPDGQKVTYHEVFSQGSVD